MSPSETKTAPLAMRARSHQLKLLGHTHCLSVEEPCREDAPYVPKHGKRKPEISIKAGIGPLFDGILWLED